MDARRHYCDLRGMVDKKSQMKYIMGHKRAAPQLVPCKITESIAISVT